MMAFRFKTSAVVMALILAFVSLSAQGAAAKRYKVAVLPRYFPIELMQRFQPLLDYLEETTGEEFKLIIPRNYAQHIEMVYKGRVDFAYQNPYVFTRVSEMIRPIAVASKGKDGVKFRGVAIVRRDSGISVPEHLKGRTVCIVAYTSAGGWVSQALFLRGRGLEPERDMKVVVAPQNKQENVIKAVYDGKADAGFVRESALDRLAKVVKMADIKVLFKGEWLPNWVFTYHPKRVPKGVAGKVQKALLAMPKGHRALKRAKLNGFVRPEETPLSAFLRAMTY